MQHQEASLYPAMLAVAEPWDRLSLMAKGGLLLHL